MKKDIEEIVEIFHSKFENPAQSVPYDSHEGGYQENLISTEDAIQQAFGVGKLSDDKTAELKKTLDKEASKWKKLDKN